MDMLTDEKLSNMEYLIKHKYHLDWLTLEELVSDLRTLQQQIKKESERAEFWQKEQLEVRQANLSLMQQLADVEQQKAFMEKLFDEILAETYQHIDPIQAISNIKEIVNRSFDYDQGGSSNDS